MYWRQRGLDATRDDGQFVDAGEQYRPVIWALDEAQREAAEKSKAEIERPISARSAAKSRSRGRVKDDVLASRAVSSKLLRE